MEPSRSQPVPEPDPSLDETIVRDEWDGETVVVEEREIAPPPRPRPLIWPWLLLLLLLVLGGLGAAFYLSRDEDDRSGATTVTVERVAVPVVVGMREARAREALRAAGLDVGLQRAAGNKPRGVVLAQKPQAGAQLERGDAVLLTISKGPPKEVVPDLVGEQSGDAVADLRAAELKAKLTQAFAAEPAGTIVRQQPKAGAKIKRGAVVVLTASKGPKPAPVPDVVGAQGSEAAATLRQAGFRVTLVTVPSTEPNGTVVAQHPLPGTVARRGAAVRLNVSEQQEGATTAAPGSTAPGSTAPASTAPAQPPAAGSAPAKVPDVVGQELADAARAFAQEGLKLAVGYVPSQEPAGRVVAQAQPPGTERSRGDTVQANVSIGPQPAAATSVPDVVGGRLDQARRTLEGAGFEVLALGLPERQVRRESKVVSQSPAGGASVPRGSLVLLYV